MEKIEKIEKILKALDKKKNPRLYKYYQNELKELIKKRDG